LEPSELEREGALWRDLARPLREFLSSLPDGRREALARWAAVEEVLAAHELETGSSLESRERGLTVRVSTRIADGLLRALGAVLGQPEETRGEAAVAWQVALDGRARFAVVFRRVADGSEELHVDWNG
jgi:hypothetical protein